MPNLDVFDPTLSTTILTLGIALVVAAIVGGGFEAAGTKIPVITGWRRQGGAALFGIALFGFGWSALQAGHWRADYNALKAGMISTPPLPAATVADNLNALAVKAAANYNRNCEIAYFIYDHKVDIPVAVKLQLNKAVRGAAPALQCYLDVAQLSAKALMETQQTVAVARPIARAASSVATAVSSSAETPAERILEAITQAGASGWVYLGPTAGSGRLGAKRTVVETSPHVGDMLTTATAVHLRDPAAQNHLSQARVVGVVPKGSSVHVNVLSGLGGSNVWARISVTQEPH
jgi:hypothetical protein